MMIQRIALWWTMTSSRMVQSCCCALRQVGMHLRGVQSLLYVMAEPSGSIYPYRKPSAGKHPFKTTRTMAGCLRKKKNWDLLGANWLLSGAGVPLSLFKSRRVAGLGFDRLLRQRPVSFLRWECDDADANQDWVLWRLAQCGCGVSEYPFQLALTGSHKENRFWGPIPPDFCMCPGVIAQNGRRDGSQNWVH